MTRLWLDDVRPAPDGWVWAKTNDEAQRVLLNNKVTHCSLDHDLGMDVVDDVDDWDQIIAASQARQESGEDFETGLDLVEWMIENDLVPENITIHSWNPDGAFRMCQRLVDQGHEVILQPYSVKNQT